MITFEMKRNREKPLEFAYDMRALSQSFFPEQPCEIKEREDWEKEKGYPLSCFLEDDLLFHLDLPADYDKNSVKAEVYRQFSKKANKTLPWGILTGIRPAKIPLRMLFEGKKEEVIRRDLEEEYLVSQSKISLVMDVAKKEYEMVKDLDEKNGYSVYIGIPFCPSICQYCSFSSYDYKSYAGKVDAYLEALDKEMAAFTLQAGGRTLHTIYVGGGTPTSLNERQLQKLMDMIQKYFSIENVLEFTVEAGRPDSITREKLEILKRAGVTRISINPQTMKQHTLELLGRKHTVESVNETFRMAREVGFDNINMDVIVGLPQEDEVDFCNTLYKIHELDPDSVTVHTLVIKRASRMRRDQMESGGEIRPEDTLIPIIQKASEDILRDYGYLPYYMYRQKNKAGTTRNTNQENVAYAKPGKECLYNTLIMEEWETIVALGSGGSTKYVIHEENRMERIENVKSVDDYIHRIDEMIERKKKLWH